MSITRGDCPFCAAVGVEIDDEHIFAQWTIRALLSQRRRGATFTVRQSTGREVIREFTTCYPEFVVHGPCKRVCNNGWMSELENHVRPFLREMMLTGRLTFLDHKKAATLAFWSFVRLMVCEFHDPSPYYFTASERLTTRRGGFPLSQTVEIWTARYSGPRPFSMFPIPITIHSRHRPDVAAFYATFVAGQFVFQVLSYPSSLPLPGGLRRKDGPWDRLLKIFPNQSAETLVWPPVDELDDDDLELLGVSFLTPMATARRRAILTDRPL